MSGQVSERPLGRDERGRPVEGDPRHGSTEELTPDEPGELVVLVGVNPGRHYVVSGETIIGRDASAGVQIPSPDISRRHARIAPEGGGRYLIADLGSRNGTQVNGVPVLAEQRLRFGDKIKLGSSTVLLFSRHDSLEHQLRESNKMESLGRLAGGVAHELNNLLATSLANVSFLLSLPPDTRLDDPEVRECLGDIDLASRRGGRFCQQLLGFARRGKYQARDINLSELVEEVLRLVRRTFDRGIRVEAEVTPDLAVVGDQGQLQQTLMNLCINARDAMPEGGTLRVLLDLVELSEAEALARPFLSPGPHARLLVVDSGVGMDEETRRRVFEPFFTTKSPGEGTGLGLAHVYGIVKNHGGHVSVESAPGRGSRFEILLPSVPSVGTGEWDGPSTTREPARPRGRVLVVDDEPLVRAGLRRLLEQFGMEAICAASGEEALEQYRAHPGGIDVVMLDLVMPGMGGEETFRALKAIDPDVRVLICSGYSDESKARAVLSAGARGFLHKPFDAEVLCQALTVAIDGPTRA